MKKLLKPALGLALVANIVACGAPADKANDTASDSTDATTEKVEEITEKTVAVKLDESNVLWTGQILGGLKSHNGTLKIADGSLDMSGTAIVGGKFTIDMKSINPTDSNYTADQTAADLVGHLSTGDFFLVDSFPTASFVIKSTDMTAKTLTGDLTVRGTTKEETIKDLNVDLTDGSAIGSLTFNRQDYGVTFDTGAKDFVLSDDIELTIKLKM